MADRRADELLTMHSRMVLQRQPFERLWQEIDDRINPTDQRFGQRATATSQKGTATTEKVFDATPGLALDRFKAYASQFLLQNQP